MDNKVTGDRIKQHFHYDWYKYVALAAVCVFVFALAYTWSGNLRSYEELDAMITCYEFYDSEFTEDALEYLNENVDGNIVKRINVQSIVPQAPGWGEVLSSYGFSDRTSFLILPESKVEEWAKTFMCMYNVYTPGGVYNTDVWGRIIPEQLRDHYRVPGSAASYYMRIAVVNQQCDNGEIDADTRDEQVAAIYAELNALNENLYFAEDANGIEGVYALRVDNLVNISSYINFKNDDYEDEKYYLVMHYRNGNIGEYGLSERTYSHYESFYLINFMLTRYGVSE